jgi:hypothetical protein
MVGPFLKEVYDGQKVNLEKNTENGFICIIKWIFNYVNKNRSLGFYQKKHI